MQGYTMPFLWVSNNDYAAVGTEIEKIKESGSNSFCVESRTYENFCGDGWWNLMDFIVQKAASLDMTVWLLDDKHFPSGSANGAVERNPQLRARFVKANHVDIVGPVQNGKLLLWSAGERRGKPIAVSLLRRTGEEKFVFVADLSQDVVGDFLYFSVKSGEYRISVIEEITGCDTRYPCVDKCNPASVRLMIDEVYAPHYERYKNTCFGGFFSDEPGFFNGCDGGFINRFSFYCGELGAQGFSYPWNDAIMKELKSRVKNFSAGELAALWNHTGENTARIRTAYMDIISRMYADNFSAQLSDWCHERGLEYASHIVEDMGAHARTRESAGHYFRSQKNADYAGVDVVLHQIKPYYNRSRHHAPVDGGYTDPKFFNNTLAKLASSCARLYPQKKGALCEIFGAYGFAESSEEMLWLVNHMFVRGINRFIPHAFSPMFPNTDCPPHFYAHGHNPMFGAYCDIIEYINKVCALTDGGESEISAAVLYHAEAEWSGKKYLPCDDVIEHLLSHQIDCDIVCADLITDCSGGLRINGRKYSVLYVPYFEYLPSLLLEKLSALSEKMRVVVVGGKVNGFECVSLRDFPKTLESELSLVNAHGNRDVRVRKINKGKTAYYFVHNEGHTDALLDIPVPENCGGVREIDFLNSKTYDIAVVGGTASVTVRGGKARIFETVAEVAARSADECAPCAVMFRKCVLRDAFDGEKEIRISDKTDILRGEPDFSGTVCIGVDIDLSDADGLIVKFSGESLSLTVGGKTYRRIESPAVFDFSEDFANERIELQIATTLAEKSKDLFSKYSVLHPIGIFSVEKTIKEERSR